MRTQLTRHERSQRGQHRPVGPRQLRLPDLTTQNLDLMPEREYLDAVRGVVAGEQCQPCKDLADELVDQFHSHSRRACGSINHSHKRAGQ